MNLLNAYTKVALIIKGSYVHKISCFSCLSAILHVLLAVTIDVHLIDAANQASFMFTHTHTLPPHADLKAELSVEFTSIVSIAQPDRPILRKHGLKQPHSRHPDVSDGC